jgi:ParB-like chromosome segregation protein Spo0J
VSVLIPIDQVVWDPSVYPRAKWSTSTIERYVDALNANAVFPPLTLEKGTNRLLDGKHRLEADKKAGRTEVDVEFVDVPDGMTHQVLRCDVVGTSWRPDEQRRPESFGR